MELLFGIYGRCFLAVGDILWVYFLVISKGNPCIPLAFPIRWLGCRSWKTPWQLRCRVLSSAGLVASLQIEHPFFWGNQFNTHKRNAGFRKKSWRSSNLLLVGFTSISDTFLIILGGFSGTFPSIELPKSLSRVCLQVSACCWPLLKEFQVQFISVFGLYIYIYIIFLYHTPICLLVTSQFCW